MRARSDLLRSARIRHVGAAYRVALNLLLPPRCPSCDETVSAEGLLCPTCFARITIVAEPCCDCCGIPFTSDEFGGTDRLCRFCREKRPAFSRARAAFRYDSHSRKLILPFKHSDRIELCRVLAAHMARSGGSLLAGADMLVPVPLHRGRLFSRGYNQSALLAQEVGRIARIPVLLDGLARQRATAPLGGKTAAERHETLADAVTVRPGRLQQIAGRRVVLIDDVMTSGATANVCADALRAAGAVDVSVLVSARVNDPRLT